MKYHVYLPKDLVRRTHEFRLVLFGFKYNNAIVCVDFVPWLAKSLDLSSRIKSLEIVGSTEPNIGYFQIGDKATIHSHKEDTFTVIVFRPPNYKNLEYFSVYPILLQSMGEETSTNDFFTKGYSSESFISTISDQNVLDSINTVLKVRNQLQHSLQEIGILKKNLAVEVPAFLKWVRAKLFTIFSYMILSVQYFTIGIIRIINYRILGVSLVKVSQVFRQLDLRLKQITYFPVQFLCYYDKSILYRDNSVLLKELGLPLFNSNLNINNSNYINLYNSIWMIINDVLLGLTTWSIINQYREELSYVAHKVVFERLLLSELERLIRWISFHHPAGFKLNNELGSFLGDLFLWSLNSWRTFMIRAFEGKQQLLFTTVWMLCHLGLSFLFGFIIDSINTITVHIFWFYHTSSKIYQKQTETIKSLFQLFRGKKYNVLRNRVDNIDNYSKPGMFFQIDQLLLGTLLFMILVLLMPTTFAFYLTFFVLRFSSILLLNFFENLLIIVNFVPLFVVLLKLKNSSRLQGGIKFEFTDRWLELSNKSLTYSEIFKNFYSLFRRQKNFRTSIISIFFKGDLIGLNHNHVIKFHYLMLPENFEKSAEIWRYFTTVHRGEYTKQPST